MCGECESEMAVTLRCEWQLTASISIDWMSRDGHNSMQIHQEDADVLLQPGSSTSPQRAGEEEELETAVQALQHSLGK